MPMRQRKFASKAQKVSDILMSPAVVERVIKGRRGRAENHFFSTSATRRNARDCTLRLHARRKYSFTMATVSAAGSVVIKMPLPQKKDTKKPLPAIAKRLQEREPTARTKTSPVVSPASATPHQAPRI